VVEQTTGFSSILKVEHEVSPGGAWAAGGPHFVARDDRGPRLLSSAFIKKRLARVPPPP
jgi:hypothetical protein